MPEIACFITEWPRWLRLREAARYSSVGEKRLVQLAKDAKVRGFQDPDSARSEWIFDRYSLDEYRENQSAGSENEIARQRARDIMKSLRK